MSNPPATTPEFTIRSELAGDASAIERLIASVFGPGANTRAAAFLREGVVHVPDLSFVALAGRQIVGTCRLTPVRWGETPVLMLGPLGVDAHYKNAGIGRRLMSATVAASDAAGEPTIILIGDLPYYGPFGFEHVLPEIITLPRPTDPTRVLARGERSSGALTRA